MNHKQKLGYTLFGAAIMALGITIGQLSAPNIEAQSNGVFDEITCRRLEVVDKSGSARVLLKTKEDETVVAIRDKVGKTAIALYAGGIVNSISVYDESGALGGGIDLFASDELKRVSVLNKAGKFVIELSASDVFGNRVALFDSVGKGGIVLHGGYKDGKRLSVFDKAGNIEWQAP